MTIWKSAIKQKDESVCYVAAQSAFLPGFMQTITNIYYQIKLMLLLSISNSCDYIKTKTLATADFDNKIG